jgi:ferritin-like metal-binding protein YciE
METTTKNNGTASDIGDSTRKNVTEEFRAFFIDELKDIYGAEKQLLHALPEMSEKAFAPRLQRAIKSHFHKTEGHVKRLEHIFKLLGEDADSKTCKAMHGLLKEANDIMDDTDEDLIRDAGIILSGQRIEHYEIATYGTLIAFAQMMKESGVATLLEETLNEEKEADQKLTDLATSFINQQAVTESHTMSEEELHPYNGYVGQWITGNF